MINLLKVNRSHINNKKKSKHDAQENYASQLSTIKVIQENKRYINKFLKENDILDFVYILVLSVKTRFLL